MADPAGNGRRYVLDPDELSPEDLDRAEAQLSDVLAGRSPYELLTDPGYAIKLTMWGLLSRDRPDLTWTEAIRTPFSAFDKPGEKAPPPIASPAGSGASGAKPSRSGSAARRRSAGTSTSSRASSTG